MTDFVSTWPSRKLEPHDKTTVVNQFLSGKSVSDLTVLFAVHRKTIEQVLREAIHHLASFVNEDAEKLAQAKTVSESEAWDRPPLNGLGTVD